MRFCIVLELVYQVPDVLSRLPNASDTSDSKPIDEENSIFKSNPAVFLDAADGDSSFGYLFSG